MQTQSIWNKNPASWEDQMFDHFIGPYLVGPNLDAGAIAPTIIWAARMSNI